ncbi:hypothetical protein Y032_0119g832 [Ancylostoma ceylanicum]|uniref:Uncharacterized protein n=1 Tax=Ancylostoma ceylanicum TaxID=53326 RepID=A0A016TB95_9BILA|nr:hypothetical protein Y032_0119g832 [Ancylostoma ceylanicum]
MKPGHPYSDCVQFFFCASQIVIRTRFIFGLTFRLNVVFRGLKVIQVRLSAIYTTKDLLTLVHSTHPSKTAPSLQSTDELNTRPTDIAEQNASAAIADRQWMTSG